MTGKDSTQYRSEGYVLLLTICLSTPLPQAVKTIKTLQINEIRNIKHTITLILINKKGSNNFILCR
jgi:hypothetical protein